MPTHWTYDQCDPQSDLEQGDFLQPTEDLRLVFRDVHPHFSHDKYLGFLVTTQSCDLVRRGGSAKASYISVAVVRPLTQVANKIIECVIPAVAPKTFKASHRLEARRVWERVLNQNEQSIGLFYLYQDADAGLAQSAVAFLRVTVALRADHYDVLLAARSGRLKPEFRAKLGWLVGNLFVRPATPDWADAPGGKARFDELVREFTEEARWIDDEVVTAALAAGVNIEAATDAELEALRPTPRLEKALNEIGAEIGRVAADVKPEQVAKLQNRLRNNGKFRKLFS